MKVAIWGPIHDSAWREQARFVARSRFPGLSILERDPIEFSEALAAAELEGEEETREVSAVVIDSGDERGHIALIYAAVLSEERIAFAEVVEAQGDPGVGVADAEEVVDESAGDLDEDEL